MATLSGRKIIVIGGTSGIGHAVAAAAQAEGARIVIASSRQASVDAALAGLPGATGAAIDVGDESSVAAFFDGIGGFDHLVYTAGDWTAAGSGALRSLDLASAGGIFRTRFWGALAAIKHGLAGIAATGSITLTSGVIAHRPQPGQALGSAMAGAVEHLAAALAVDLAPIRVNVVCPGAIATPIWERMPAAARSERLQKMTARLPLPRIGEPAEIAETYLHLMKAEYTTGQRLMVDGGLTLV